MNTPRTTPKSPARDRRADGSTPGRVALRSLQILAAALLVVATAAREWLRLRRLPLRERLERACGRALVRGCTRLGSTFIKVGQIASTRADLLPRGLFEELRALQDRVPPVPFEHVRATLEADFGQPLEALFSEFDVEPVAAASVAQVHRARLRRDGREVAVKVRRPDVLQKVRLDRAILLSLARWLERGVPTLHLISLEEALQGFCDAVEQQLHLSNEARNNARFSANFADDPEVLLPTLEPSLCSDSVLTMDFLRGVHEQDLLAGGGIDVRRVVEAGMRTVCRMIFVHGFVHADLHPGNLLFLAPGRLVLLDLGLVGELDDADRLTTAQLIHALVGGDGATVARLFYENAPHQAVRDYDAYEREIRDFISSVVDKGLGQLQVTVEIGRIFDILRRHRIQARAHMTMVNLALLTAEGMGRRLAPELDLSRAALPYLAEALGLTAAPVSRARA